MEKLGVAVVGPGWAGGEHIKAYKNNPNVEVIAVCGRDKARTKARVEEADLTCELYTDFEEILKRDDVQIISICTPNDLHVKQGIAAAEAGKNFLIEKPIALNVADLRKLRDVVRKTKVKTVVGFVLRWNPLYQTIKPLIEDNAIGNIFYGEVDYFHGIGPWYKQFEWNVKKSIGGSSLLSAGCHSVDGLLWFLNDDAVEVTSYSTHSKNENYEAYEYDPTSVTIIKFKNGAIGKVASSIECVQPYVFNINLVGDKGTIKNNQLYSHKMPGQTGFATIPTILPDSGDVTHHPYQGEIDHLVDCVLNDKESFVNVENGIKTHEICLAAEISVKEGRSVKLPLLD